MPTEKPRITFMVSNDVKNQIEEYQYDNRIKNQSQAILSLISAGLEQISKGEKENNGFERKNEYTIEEMNLLDAIRDLDEPGKIAVRAVLETQQQRIRECGPAVKLQSVEIVRKRIPMIQGTHEAEIQMRYRSKQEQRELQQSETLLPDPT